MVTLRLPLLTAIALCATAGSVARADLLSGLQLHTTLDAANISGANVLDTATPAQNGVINGTVPQVAGRIGGALDFNNSDANFVNFGNVFNPGTGSYTVSFWFNSDEIGVAGTDVLMGKGNAGSADAGWVVFEENNTLYVRAGIGGTGVGQRFSEQINLTNANVGNSQWHHLALVIDRGTNTIEGYLDGSGAGFAAGGGGPTANTIGAGSNITNTSNLLYGVRSTAGTPFDGRLDDVAIYSRALTGQEISTIVGAGFAPTARNVQTAEAGPLGGTFVALTPTDDAFVDSAVPSSVRNDPAGANGHLGGLVISAQDSPVLKFDLSGITAPTGFKVDVVPGSARLVMFETDNGINATNITGHELLGDWDESTVTYNSLPAFAAANLFSSATHATGENRFGGTLLDELVERWLNDPMGNFGLILTALGDEDAYLSRTQANAPRLEFEYQINAVPEPTSWTLWLGAAGLGFMCWRGRRRFLTRASR